MIVRLHGERFKAALPDVAAPLVMAVVMADVRRHQPLHPATEISILAWPQQQMKVIGQQAIPQQPHRNSFVGDPHDVHEASKIVRVVKYADASVATVGHLVNISALR